MHLTLQHAVPIHAEDLIEEYDWQSERQMARWTGGNNKPTHLDVTAGYTQKVGRLTWSINPQVKLSRDA
jgi:hypothetical protein